MQINTSFLQIVHTSIYMHVSISVGKVPKLKVLGQRVCAFVILITIVELPSAGFALLFFFPLPFSLLLLLVFSPSLSHFVLILCKFVTNMWRKYQSYSSISQNSNLVFKKSKIFYLVQMFLFFDFSIPST